MSNRKNHIDLTLFITVLTLMLLSVAIVYSASVMWAEVKFGNAGKLMGSHAMKVMIGIGAIMLGISIDYNKYRQWTKPAVIAAVGLLGLTLILGTMMKGATRWLQLAGMSFQPVEFAKFALFFHLCALIARNEGDIRDFHKGYLPMLFWIGGIAGLVLLQPNISNGSMIIALSMLLLFVARARVKHLLATAAAAIPLVGLYLMIRPNQFGRFMNWISGKHTHGDVNYQLWQGIIGFANGGLFGVGPGESKQRDLFLPESYGDFIFSIVGEEYGLIGTLFILTLFLIIMLRGFKIARYAPNEFGRLMAIAITSTITLYALVNAFVTLGILPTTGLPMPFISYGGSNLLFMSFAVGVLLNISAQTQLHPREEAAPDDTPVANTVVPARGRVF